MEFDLNHGTAVLERALAVLRAMLEGLPQAWTDATEGPDTLTGMHPELGEVRLRQLLSCWVAHDLGHIVQVARVMAKQYRDAVGPWTASLSVMA